MQSVLLTDLYQLTMLQGYHEARMNQTAVFELFVRKLPPQRGFLVAAGLEQVLEYLERLAFAEWELDWMRESGYFSSEFVDSLRNLRFTGDVDAVPEGTVFFPYEPIIRVVAPMREAQLVETRIINLLHFQSIIASKAARSVLVAQGKSLIDFGLRRAHGAEAGVLAARASYLAGFTGTATVLAGSRFGVPVYGTMAHSFVQAHDDEVAAFEHFADAQPNNVVLLIDTYDTEAAAEKVVRLAPRLKAKGISIRAVRLDSGDLADHARKVRRILDDGGLPQVKILASGNLDEYKLRDLMTAQAPIDSFAIGTCLTTSADMPYLDCAYKLQEYAGRPRRKKSEGKATWPGRKQVYRWFDGEGRIMRDVVTLLDDKLDGLPLLEPVMREGRRVGVPVPLAESRDRAKAELARLPKELQELAEGATITAEISEPLRRLADSLSPSS